MRSRTITSDVVVAFCLCKRKAFLLLRGDTGEPIHEYVRLLDTHAASNQNIYLGTLAASGLKVCNDQKEGVAAKADVLSTVQLKVADLETTVDALVIVSSGNSKVRRCYEPHLVIGTNSIPKEQLVRLAFVGYVLSEAYHYRPKSGKIICFSGDSQRIQLSKLIADLLPVIKTIRAWKSNEPPDSPPIFLTDHCSLCQFQQKCFAQAEKEDNLSLLNRMTPRLIQKYHKKGIFTVNQLSYLFKPRRKKKNRNYKPPVFILELQALALRTGKIYIDQPALIPENPTELFLDIEGIPDHGIQYLIGLIVSTKGRIEYHSFWADKAEDELGIFTAMLRFLEEYPDAPIYHYGSYEVKALARIAKKYNIIVESVKIRFVNVNSFIFGKVYFPIRSNNLKNVGRFVGATWTSPDASGLQSMVWRFQWEINKSDALKDQILAYNIEDCQALRLLVSELRNIGKAGATRSDVDFADTPKKSTTTSGQSIHAVLEEILKSAHAEYSKNCIAVGQRKIENNSDQKRGPGASKGHQAYRRIVPSKAGNVIRLRQPKKCPRHKDEVLDPSVKVAEHTVIDLSFTKTGCRKTITKYIGTMGHCPRCRIDYMPVLIRKFQGRLFGHCFRAWTVYQRITLRLPYRVISQVIGDLFYENITEGCIVNFVVGIAKYYAPTEKIILSRILASPFIHVDETKISIQGIDQYVWVLTNGIHVAFRLTETRESFSLQEILRGYKGVLISDFYGGYDACECRQQKCLVHLIRDLNDDLWKNPFNTELEGFVGAFRDLIIPIMADIDRHGLKRRNLNKHRALVDRSYRKVFLGRDYKCEIVQKYQKRFVRYRESLFRFLEEDGIPWNNNTAERAIRHLAVQRKISGTFFKRVAPFYLRLLAIAQTCRFQGKSFLGFLISGEMDIDQFKKQKRSRSSVPVCSAKLNKV